MSRGAQLLLRRLTTTISPNLPSGVRVSAPPRNFVLTVSSSLSSLLSRRRFSSHQPADHHPSPPPSTDDNNVAPDVTTQELKQRIQKYLDGDAEALPSIFEAILARKLSGKHEDTDDELMEELRLKNANGNGDGEDAEFSDSEDYLSESDDDLSESDDELSD